MNDDARASGTFFDPQTGASHPMVLNKNQMQVVLQVQIPGMPKPLTLSFTQGTSGGLTGPGSGNSTVPSQTDGVQRDPALVGHWLYSESYTSGTFSGASQTRMIIYPNGGYQYGDSQFAGGGGGIGGSSGNGELETGEWKTQNRIIYIKGKGLAQWQPYARYYVEGASMMLTFSDGSKQVWKRIQ